MFLGEDLVVRDLTRIGTFVALVLFVLSGCNIGALFNPSLEPPPSVDAGGDGSTDDQPSDGSSDGSSDGGAVTGRTLVAELEHTLTDESTLTPGEVDKIVAAAEAEVPDLESPDISTVLPLLIGGAQKGIGSIGRLDDEERLALVRLVNRQAARSIRGRHELVAAGASGARGLDPNAPALENLLAKIARASVANINRTGVSASRVSEAAGAATGSLVSSLGEGGLRKEHLNKAIQEIARGAVQGLTASGLDPGEAIETAVRRICEGATEGVASLSVDGVEDRDLPSLVEVVTSGATSGAEALAVDRDGFTSLVTKVTEGAASGVERVTAARGTTLQAVDVEKMVAGISAGATRAVKSVSLVDTTDVAQTKGVITAITESTSRAVSTMSFSGVTGLSTDATLRRVARGAAEGAQELSDAGMSETDLADAILIVRVIDPLSGAEETVDESSYADEISAGVQDGRNEPPTADAGPDQSAIVDETVSITGTGSDAEDDPSELSFQWRMIGRPDDSSAILQNADTATVSFTPDVDGSFELNLIVSDSGGKSAESALVVLVDPPASQSTYGGMTAEERFNLAETAHRERRYADARAEYRTLILYYPVNEYTPDGYLGLGWTYDRLGNRPAALATFEDARALHTAGEAHFTAEVYAEATLAAATKLMWNIGEPERGRDYFQEIFDDFPGTALQASALRGLAAYDSYVGDPVAARAKFQDVLDNYNPDNHSKYWARRSIAMSYRNEAEYLTAIAELDAMLADDTQLYNNDGVVDQEFLGRIVLDRGYIYRQFGELVAAENAFRAAADDSRLHAEDRAIALKMLGDTYLWDLREYQDAIDTFDELESTYAPNPASPLLPNPWMIGYGALNRGHAMRHLADDTPFGAAREAAVDDAIAEFRYVVDHFPVATYGQAALWARVEIGQMQIWDDRRMYNEARANHEAAIAGVGENDDRTVVAQALYAIGDTYFREARDADDDYTADQMYLYQEAIDYFEQVHVGNFPAVRPDRWFFRNAPSRIAQAFAGLGRYAEARAYFEDLIADSDAYDVHNRAWLQFDYADTYQDEYWDAERDELLSEMEALLPIAIAEFEEVGTYTEDGNYVDNGQPWANALIQIGELNRVHGKHHLHDQDDAAAAAPYFNAALDTVEQITTAVFPDLDPNEWVFRRAAEIEAEVFGGLGRYADARSALATVRTNAEAAGDYTTAAWAQYEIGDWFREEAQELDVHDVATYNQAAALFEDARAAYREAIAIVDIDGSYPNDGKPAAESQVRIGHSYGRQAEALEHDSNQDFATIETELVDLYRSAIQELTVVVGDPGNGTPSAPQTGIAADLQMLAAEDGRFAAEAQRRIGWANYRVIMALHHRGGMDETAPEYTEYLGYALDAFLAVDDYGRVEPHDVFNARRGEVETRIALGGAANIATAESLVFGALSDPAFNDHDVTDMAVTYGRVLVHDHEEIIADDSTFAVGGVNYWALTAETLLTTVVDEYAHVDGGRRAAEATELLGELYGRVADHHDSVGDFALADGLWQDAVDAFSALSTAYPDVDGDEFTGVGYYRTGTTYIDWGHAVRRRGDGPAADGLFASATAPLETARDFYEWVWGGNMAYDSLWGLGQVYSARGSIAESIGAATAAVGYFGDAVAVQTTIIDDHLHWLWSEAAGQAYLVRGEAYLELGRLESDAVAADALFDSAIADFTVTRDAYGHERGGDLGVEAQDRIDEATALRDAN